MLTTETVKSKLYEIVNQERIYHTFRPGMHFTLCLYASVTR